MTSTKKIKSFIFKKGNKLTNAEMASKLGVPTMRFAGVLAAMKRKDELSNDFLKSDITKKSKSIKTSKTTSISFEKIAKVKPSDLTVSFIKSLVKNKCNFIELI